MKEKLNNLQPKIKVLETNQLETNQLIEILKEQGNEVVILDLNDPNLRSGWINPLTGESGTNKF